MALHPGVYHGLLNANNIQKCKENRGTFYDVNKKPRKWVGVVHLVTQA